MVAAFEEMGNPFVENETNLVQIATKAVMNPEVSRQVHTAEKIGQEQFEIFIKNRLLSETSSLYDVISKNKFLIFK